MIFSQNLFRRPTPTCIVCRNWKSNFLYVGAPPTSIACRISFRNSLCWGPQTLIEKGCYKCIFVQSTTGNVTFQILECKCQYKIVHV